MDYTKEEFLEDWEHFLKCISFNNSHMDNQAIDFLLYGPEKICEALDLAQQKK